MRTVFVTGADGFAGSHLVQYLTTHGYDVVAGVRNRARKLQYERDGIKALVCNVTDAINVARAVASVQPDGVVHLAGIASPTQANAEPLDAYQSIVTPWANVLDGVRRAVPRARVLLVSACDVYGDAGADGRRLSESTPLEPVSTYGSLKATAEAIAHTYHRDYHLNLTIARPFHFTGPGQSDRFFLGAAARQLGEWDVERHGRRLELPDLDCQRDWIHVKDLVVALERLLADGRPNEAYNICSGQAVTCREVVQEMLKAFELDLELVDAPSSDDVPQIRVLCGDNTKLSNELGWSPTRDALEAVRELANTYRTTTAVGR